MPQINNKSVPLRLMMFTTIGFLFLVVILVFFVILQFQFQAKKSMEEWMLSSSEIYRNSIEEKFQNYVTGTDAVALNSSVRESLWLTDITEMEMVDLGNKLKRNVDSITYSFYDAQDIYYYNIYSFLPTTGGYFFNLDRAYASPWYDQLNESKLESITWYSYSRFTKSIHWNTAKVMQRQAWSTVGDGDGDCYQTLSINLNNLFSSKKIFSEDSNVQVYAFDNETGNCIYNGGDEYIANANEYYKYISESANAFETSIHQTNLQNDSTTLTLQRIPTMQMTIVMAFDKASRNIQTAVSDNFFLIILVVPFLYLLIFQIVFYRRFKRRLDHVTSTIDRFDSESQIKIVPLEGADELSHIDRHLVRMLERIRTLIIENYTQKMQNISARLEVLLVCINPHFLYNTLNTISASACMEGADDTVNMIDSLSAMFRYSCDTSEKLVSLKMEISNIKEYLSIQSVRYQERLKININITPDCMPVLVPKLTLQPIIENCFKHGFTTNSANDTRYIINITGSIIGDYLEIAVEDNGCGISADILEKLKSRLHSSAEETISDEIGIRNVNSRIKLICGDTYGIDIESEQGKYTRILLRFPK